MEVPVHGGKIQKFMFEMESFGWRRTCQLNLVEMLYRYTIIGSTGLVLYSLVVTSFLKL